jgi:predicted nucleotidyltransferase
MELNETLQKVVRILTAEVNAEKIYLFGSQATHSSNDDSDIDLMVIAPSDKSQKVRNSEARLALAGLKHSFDVFVYTPREIEEYSSLLSSIPWTAINKGELIYEHH